MSILQLLKTSIFVTATALISNGVAKSAKEGPEVNAEKQELIGVNGEQAEAVKSEEAGKLEKTKKNEAKGEEKQPSALDVLSISEEKSDDLKKVETKNETMGEEKQPSALDAQAVPAKQPEAIKKVEPKKGEKPAKALDAQAVPAKQPEATKKVEPKKEEAIAFDTQAVPAKQPEATKKVKAKKEEKQPTEEGKKAEMQPIVENKHTPAEVIGSVSVNNESAENLVILAEKSYNGIGGEKNILKAIELFEKAAKKGSGYACRRLGLEYSDFAFDDQTPRDDKKARSWFEKGVELGDTESMFYLSEFVFEGRGGGKDEKRGTQLLLQAARSGCQNAAHRALKLDKKTGKLSEGQTSEEKFVSLTVEDKKLFYGLDKQLKNSLALR